MKRSTWFKMAKAGIDPKFFNMVSQFAHFFTWYSICVTAGIITRNTRFVLGTALLCVLYSTIHEFYWDPRHEDPETRGSDIEDFCYLIAGGACGCFVAWFFLLTRLHK